MAGRASRMVDDLARASARTEIAIRRLKEAMAAAASGKKMKGGEK